MERKHWRGMEWDPNENKFFYNKPGVDAEDGIPENHLCGMSGLQHIKANVRGFTIDSAVSAATGFPLSFRVRREGVATVQNYKYMRHMFAYKFSVAGASALALNNIVFCSDRGYWQIGFILFILSSAGSVFGTLMRKEWVSFT
mmetsp:Transcript_25932/g.38119  ORF Transcript_25932/g.38119 Transcript_25932/m.38119 type:complete len:143 (-) Transcript_25932:562-990(-)